MSTAIPFWLRPLEHIALSSSALSVYVASLSSISGGRLLLLLKLLLH